MTNPSVPEHPIVNVYHFDCLSFNPKQEFVAIFSAVPTPVKVPCGNELALHNTALFVQSWPGEGGELVLFTQVVNVPSDPVDDEIV